MNTIFKILLFSLLLAFSYGCKKIAINPFDNYFPKTTKGLIKGSYDTIPAGCGYFNLQESSGKFRLYYQVYMDDYSKILGKGFVYIIDTARVPMTDVIPDDSFLDSISNIEFDIEPLEKKINNFNYKIINRRDPNIVQVNNKTLDIISLTLNFEIDSNKNELLLIRKFDYYNLKSR